MEGRSRKSRKTGTTKSVEKRLRFEYVLVYSEISLISFLTTLTLLNRSAI